MAHPNLDWPLMRNNITREDLDTLVEFLRGDDPILTQSRQVEAFEREWGEWLGMPHNVFVNSGSSANEITMLVLRELRGEGEVIVPALTWVSDIASILHAGLNPVFVDIDPATLGMDIGQAIEKTTDKTLAIFPTHILGYNALDRRLIDHCASRGILLFEDVCESHGATFEGQKCGSFGAVSNFSFYYAHHLSTIEGGMICTSDETFYQMSRVARSHGMVREARSESFRADYATRFPDLNPSFIFAFPAHNMRSTEINAVLGRSQLKRLDGNNVRRIRNLGLFLQGLDPERYFTEFAVEGSCNYAFTLVLRQPDEAFRERVMQTLSECKVEFRRGTSGGGNQLRQPYLRRIFGDAYRDYPRVDHIHFFGFYIGNYPDLDEAKIIELTHILNSL